MLEKKEICLVFIYWSYAIGISEFQQIFFKYFSLPCTCHILKTITAMLPTVKLGTK